MSQVTETGSEVLQKLYADSQNSDNGWPLYTYVSFGSIPNQDWSSFTYESASPSNKLSFKSSEGSTLGIVATRSGDENKGSNSLSMNLKTTSKDSFLASSVDSWGSGSYSAKKLKFVDSSATLSLSVLFFIKSNNQMKIQLRIFRNGTK